MNGLVFIAGLGHSGTTFLQLLMSSNKEMVGLGEIGLFLKKRKKGSVKHPTCSCGNEVSECNFWSQIQPEDGFEDILRVAQQMYPGKTLIDSSKSFDSFTRYYVNQKNLKSDVKVIFLVRDFRSWVVSRARNARKKNRKRYGFVVDAYKWLFLNIRMKRIIKRSGLKCVSVFYEDLVFDQEVEMNRIFNSVKVKGAFNNSGLDSGEVHDIYGNRMKNDPKKLKTTIYDSTWKKNLWLMLLIPVFIPQYWYMYNLKKHK